MAAERAVAVVVLAVDVGSHGTAEADLARAGRDRHEPSLRDGVPQQLVERIRLRRR